MKKKPRTFKTVNRPVIIYSTNTRLASILNSLYTFSKPLFK